MKKFHLLIFAVAITLTLQATSQADPTSILRSRAGLSTAAGLLAVEVGPFADRFALSLGWLPSIQLDEQTLSLMPNASTGTRLAFSGRSYLRSGHTPFVGTTFVSKGDRQAQNRHC